MKISGQELQLFLDQVFRDMPKGSHAATIIFQFSSAVRAQPWCAEDILKEMIKYFGRNYDNVLNDNIRLAQFQPPPIIILKDKTGGK